MDYILKNPALEGIAIDPAVSVCRIVRERYASENQNKKTSPEDAKHEIQSTRSVALARDRAGPRVQQDRDQRADLQRTQSRLRPPPATREPPRNALEACPAASDRCWCRC